MFQNRREEEFTKPKLGFYLLYPVRFKVSIKKKSGKPKHGGGLSVTCWPSITPPPLKTAWCSVISPPALHISSISKRLGVQPTYLRERRPGGWAGSRGTVGVTTTWSRWTVRWAGRDPQCADWNYWILTVWEGKRRGGGEANDLSKRWGEAAVSALIVRGGAYLPTSWSPRVHCWKKTSDALKYLYH